MGEKWGAMDQRLVCGQNQVKGETFPVNGKGHWLVQNMVIKQCRQADSEGSVGTSIWMLKSLTTIYGVQLQFNDTEVLAFAVKNEVPDGSDFFFGWPTQCRLKWATVKNLEGSAWVL